MTVLRDLSLLLFPQACAGCGAFDTALCPSCTGALAGGWSEVSARAPYLQDIVPTMVEAEGLERPGDPLARFPVYALGAYRGARRRIIVRWKNTVNVELNAAISALVRNRTREIAATKVAGDARILVVPAPSGRARIRDGRFVAGVLAEAVAAGLREAGWSATVACCLEKVTSRGGLPDGRRLGDLWREAAGRASGHPRRGGGQLARGAKKRSIRLARGWERPRGIVVLVDDVLTTGATLAGCAEALEGAAIGCAIVLAAAADPRAKSVTRVASSG